MKGFSGIISSTTLKFRNGDFFFFVSSDRCIVPNRICNVLMCQFQTKCLRLDFPQEREKKEVGHNRCSCFQSLPTITNVNLNETQTAFGKYFLQQNPPSSRIPEVHFTDKDTGGSQRQGQTPVEQEDVKYNCSHPLLACPSRKARGRIAARACCALS